LLAWRHRLTDKLSRLLREGVRLDLTNTPALHAFYLAYQGYNERDMQHNLARLYGTPPEPLLPTTERAGASPKIRVGFLSAHFRNHTIGRLMQGFIAQLTRDALIRGTLKTLHAAAFRCGA